MKKFINACLSKYRKGSCTFSKAIIIIVAFIENPLRALRSFASLREIFKNFINVCLILSLLLFLACQNQSNNEKLEIKIEPQSIPANGLATTKITVRLKSAKKDIEHISILIVSGSDLVSLVKKDLQETDNKYSEVILQSRLESGEVKIHISYKDYEEEQILSIYPVYNDTDQDGFPDVVELTSEQDRLNFRRWFSSIAEMQFYHINNSWDISSRDCAGLLRFAYREALKCHTNEWLSSIRFATDVTIPDVEKYNYPLVPLLETNLFRIRKGTFKASDLTDSTFCNSVRTHYLYEYNTIYLGRTSEMVEKGDLLFYRQDNKWYLPSHSMIFIGDDNGIPEIDNDDWVVYHTGPTDSTSGEIKKVPLSVLKQHPEEHWRPLSENPYFLGFYRWCILD